MTEKEKIQLMWETIDQLNTLAYDHRGDKHMDYVFRKTMAILNQIPSPENEAESPLEKEDPIELMLLYWKLDKKQKNGTFTSEDAITIVYVCIELGKAGYTLNDDESDWIPPQNGN